MLKALLAASIAMLACCTAAVLAGPVQPLRDLDTPVDAVPVILAAPSDGIAAVASGPTPPVLEVAFVDGLDSVGFLAFPYPDHVAASRQEPVPPNGSVQPAVVPLPAPIYAAAGLLAVTLLTRRAILRAC